VAVAEHEGLVKAALAESAAGLAEQAEARQQASRLETEQAYAKRTLDEARRKVTELADAAGQHHREAERLRAAAAGRAGPVEQARKEAEKVEAEAAKLAVAESAKAEEELERNVAELREVQEKNQRLLMDQRMRRYDLEKQAAAVAEEARASHNTDIAAFTAQPGEDFEQRCASVRRRLEALGAVNPLAADEFEQERKDLGRLAGQRDDVAAAKVNLEQTMLELDRHAREVFVRTYGEVRGHFQEIFRTLFLEGEADLVLVNETNPLESEIAITARPKGKTPKRLEQLSDGEKALLAVSLLFAFYRVKPAPFCFLDEIDAPLDDINVGRFADYLKQMAAGTQVIVITHNRATVERAESLFGVTAEEPGVSQLVSVSLAQFREQQPEQGQGTRD
jgi:chromosome segregation protein